MREADAISCCAGYAATIIAGFPEEHAAEGCEIDFRRAEDMVETAKVQAVELMQRPENRAAVVRIAEELRVHKHVDVDHVAFVIEVVDGERTEGDCEWFLSLRRDILGGS